MNLFSAGIIAVIIKKRWVQKLSGIIFCMILIDILFPLPKFKEYSKAVYAVDGTMLTAYLTNDQKWRLRTELEEVSPELIKAIIAKEDKRFFYHLGFDPFAIVRSFITNSFSSKKLSGASTITMQVVRILEPKKRTYLNKLLEIFRAVQLEIHFSKREILGIYLSYLPLGGNIEGISSASFIFYNHPPKTLSISQAVMLAVIPGNPNLLRLDRINDEIKNRRDYWLKRFADEKAFSKESVDDALNEPILQHRFAIPVIAPHLCLYLKERASYESDKIKSSLNLQIQKNAEDILLNYINKIRSKKISNGAVIIIDNKNSSVVGYVGSSDFSDKKSRGQVNGVIAPRSPGSTLKPALYADAIETGFLTPGTKLLDVPIEIAGYEPENYKLNFNGFVTTEFALVNSLNIPAVLLLNQIGIKSFVELLERGGCNEIKKQKDKLGLSMILGGCSVTLEELSRFYSIFAKGGYLYPLSFHKTNLQSEDRIRMFSKETCYLIADILSGTKRNDVTVDLDFSKLPKFAWKTGTSYGKRDAWAIGFNPNFTIGVWVGNFDGSSSPFLNGAESALPLLAELFNVIDYNSRNKWFDKPSDVYSREVCSVSGLLPTNDCTERRIELAIKNRSHNQLCDIHQKVLVSNDEKTQYCMECLPDSNYKQKIYEVLNKDLIRWYRKNNIAYDSIPQHNPECTASLDGENPKIISPSESFEYFIDEDEPQEIVLLASSNPKIQFHYWYVNDVLIAKCKQGEKAFYKLSSGKIKIVCLNDLGKSTKVEIVVKTY